MPRLPMRGPGAGRPPALTDVLTSAASYAKDEKAAATRRAYRADFANFCAWASKIDVAALPAEPATIAGYLAHLADSGRSPSTIGRRLAAIAYAHRLKGLNSPTTAEAVRTVLRGIRRRLGVAVSRKAPATAAAIAAMLERIPPGSLSGCRDRALLLIGFAAALRRSELVDLKVNDLELQADGLLIHIRKSKTDQEGEGAAVAVPNGGKLRPVEALTEWLTSAKIVDGHIFRAIDRHGKVNKTGLSDRSVANVIKRWAKAAGLDPAIFSGHSLRAGFVTSALEHGADMFKVMDVTRHRRVETLKGYDRRAQAFRNHAGAGFL